MSRHLSTLPRTREAIAVRDRECASSPHLVRISETDHLDPPDGMENPHLPRRTEREAAKLLAILDSLPPGRSGA